MFIVGSFPGSPWSGPNASLPVLGSRRLYRIKALRAGEKQGMDVITSIAVFMLILPAAGALLCALVKGRCRPAAGAIAAIVTGLAAWLTFSTFGASHTQMLGSLPWLHGIVDAPLLGILIDPLASLMLLVAVP